MWVESIWQEQKHTTQEKRSCTELTSWHKMKRLLVLHCLLGFSTHHFWQQEHWHLQKSTFTHSTPLQPHSSSTLLHKGRIRRAALPLGPCAYPKKIHRWSLSQCQAQCSSPNKTRLHFSVCCSRLHTSSSSIQFVINRYYKRIHTV